MHSITYKSPIVELPGITGALDKDGNLLHAKPNWGNRGQIPIKSTMPAMAYRKRSECVPVRSKRTVSSSAQ